MKTGSMRRCLLVAGGLNAELNHSLYAHELSWWAERLTALGYSCRLCLADGIVSECLPASAKLTGAKREDVEAGLEWLAGVDETGSGLLVISNHGDRSGICLWGPDILTVDQLARGLQPAKGKMALVMGQCHGGVFGALAGVRTVVLSACTAEESSWACEAPPGLVYDEFLYQLGTALFGAPDDAPQPEPARCPISLLDAFHWARAQDRRQETPMIFDPSGLAGEIVI